MSLSVSVAKLECEKVTIKLPISVMIIDSIRICIRVSEPSFAARVAMSEIVDAQVITQDGISADYLISFILIASAVTQLVESDEEIEIV